MSHGRRAFDLHSGRDPWAGDRPPYQYHADNAADHHLPCLLSVHPSLLWDCSPQKVPRTLPHVSEMPRYASVSASMNRRGQDRRECVRTMRLQDNWNGAHLTMISKGTSILFSGCKGRVTLAT